MGGGGVGVIMMSYLVLSNQHIFPIIYWASAYNLLTMCSPCTTCVYLISSCEFSNLVVACGWVLLTICLSFPYRLLITSAHLLSMCWPCMICAQSKIRCKFRHLVIAYHSLSFPSIPLSLPHHPLPFPYHSLIISFPFLYHVLSLPYHPITIPLPVAYHFLTISLPFT